MGSGKGQIRRAQTVSPSRPEDAVAEFSQKTWDEFVELGDLRDVSIYQYYLGKTVEIVAGLVITKFTDKEYEKAVADLFADAVQVGALSLPEPYKAEDFRFVMAVGSSMAWDGSMDIIFKSKPELKSEMTTTPVPPVYMSMNNIYVGYFLGQAVKGLEDILAMIEAQKSF